MREVRRWGAQYQMTLKDILEAALRGFLQARTSRQHRFTLRKHIFRGKGLAPDLQPGDWNQVRTRIYEGHGG